MLKVHAKSSKREVRDTRSEALPIWAWMGRIFSLRSSVLTGTSRFSVCALTTTRPNHKCCTLRHPPVVLLQSEVTYTPGLKEAFPGLSGQPTDVICMHMTPDGSSWWLGGQRGEIKEMSASNPTSMKTVVNIAGVSNIPFYEAYEEVMNTRDGKVNPVVAC